MHHTVDAGEGGSAAVVAMRIELFLGEDIPTCLEEGQKSVMVNEA